MPEKPAVLFVCLGNICRSPLAEAAFRHACKEAGLDALADSAGTAAYHVGEPPDPRSIAMAASKGIDIGHYRGRQIERSDFHRFTHIFALDHSNLQDIIAFAPDDGSASISLLLDVVPGRLGQSVADPYYGDEGGFIETWNDVTEAATSLLELFSDPRQSDMQTFER